MIEPILRADDVRDSMPLFRSGCGGSIPTSALQLSIRKCDVHRAIELNRVWHSRLPKVDWSNIVRCSCHICFVAEFDDIAYASAIWSSPVARLLNGFDWLELRRLAIAPDAPKNTATRMLRIMRIVISKDLPHITNLISYQDTEVHIGTIYKAAGWKKTTRKIVGKTGWNSRKRNQMQTTADKVRWDMSVRKSGVLDVEKISSGQQMENTLFTQMEISNANTNEPNNRSL